VNRRPVENRGLNFALLEGYHTALMKGRYPVCSLFIEIAPAAVDVNIHPAKREVKFHQETEVRRLVAQAVRQTLLRFHASGQSPESTAHGPQSTVRSPEVGGPTAESGVLPNFPQNLRPPSPPQPAPPAQPSLQMGFGHKPAVHAANQTGLTDQTNRTHLTQSPPAPPPAIAALQTVGPVPLLNVPYDW